MGKWAYRWGLCTSSVTNQILSQQPGLSSERTSGDPGDEASNPAECEGLARACGKTHAGMSAHLELESSQLTSVVLILIKGVIITCMGR